MVIEVIELTLENIPDEEIIAINEDNECRLTNVTHFIKIPKVW